MYSDYAEGGLRVPNMDIKFKSLKLAWIARLISNQPGLESWRVIPDHYFSKYSGLNFLLCCNYDEKCLDQSGMPSFYKQILLFFKDLRVLFNQDTGQDMILFNNKEILTMVRQFAITNGSKGTSLQFMTFSTKVLGNFSLCNFLTFFKSYRPSQSFFLKKPNHLNI